MIRLLTILCCVAAAARATPAAELVLSKPFHHLRNAEPREWSHEPEQAEARSLVVDFDLGEDASSFQLLTLRQAGVKQPWSVQLNGRKLGQLEQDHNDLEAALEVPGGLLKPAGNKLVIATTSATPDDIHVGEIVLHQVARQTLTAGAALAVTVTDAESGNALPCRLTIVAAKSGALVLLGARSDERLAVRSGVVYTLDGKANVGLRPGRYKVWAGRGFEYSLAAAEVELGGGERGDLALELRREVATPGLVACDTHLHTGEFARHGDASLVERLITLAGEGIELPISTEHDQHIDFAPEAKRIGAAEFFTTVIGCEVTTSEGHFNSFPVVAGSEPAQHRLRAWPQIFQGIFATPGVKVVILNHARDVHAGFRPFDPQNFDADTGRFVGGRRLEANGLELINSGAQQSDPLRLVRDWFALIKSGHKIAGVGSSDSHTVNFAIVGQARTYVPCADGDASRLDAGAAIDGFLAGETHVSFGLLTRLELGGNGGLTAKVLGPGWTRAEKLTLFADGVAIDVIEIPQEEGAKAGLKAEHSWSVATLGVPTGSFLVAVASGPGIDAPYWPMMPPYQPTTPDFEPYVMGVSPVRWVK